MKPKVALVKDGFLPAGSENTRGRMSLAAIERCKALAAEGWDIDGYSKSTAPTTVAKTEDKVSKPTADFSGVADVPDVPDESRPESVWTAFIYNGEKKQTVGMRTVCNQCNSSLSYCRCRTPYVWLDFETQAAVSFSPLTK